MKPLKGSVKSLVVAILVSIYFLGLWMKIEADMEREKCKEIGCYSAWRKE